MRRAFVIAVIAAIAASGLAAIGLGVGSVASAATPPVATKNVTIAQTKCPGAAAYFCFKAAALTVKPNTKVIWKNATGVQHNVIRCSVATCGVNGGTGKDVNFKSKTINPTKTFAFTFRKKGTYRYTCTIHGYFMMHGTVTVK